MQKNTIAIILPTFNESQSLPILLNKIRKVLPNSVVFIVDDSNDTENNKIKKIVRKYKNIDLITRQKKLGRGSAILMGLEKALKNKSITYFFEMDTDLSHDPAELPLFLASQQKEDAQLVIGSRYLLKSKIVGWPLKRLILSKLINLCLNLWLQVGITDYTNGYRLYQRKTAEYLIKTKLQEKNFIVLSESAFILHKKKFKIVEIPITFTDRKYGESSVGMKEVFMCLIGALRIRIRYR